MVWEPLSHSLGGGSTCMLCRILQVDCHIRPTLRNLPKHTLLHPLSRSAEAGLLFYITVFTRAKHGDAAAARRAAPRAAAAVPRKDCCCGGLRGAAAGCSTRIYLCALAAILRSRPAISSRLALPRLWVPSCRGRDAGCRGGRQERRTGRARDVLQARAVEQRVLEWSSAGAATAAAVLRRRQAATCCRLAGCWCAAAGACLAWSAPAAPAQSLPWGGRAPSCRSPRRLLPPRYVSQPQVGAPHVLQHACCCCYCRQPARAGVQPGILIAAVAAGSAAAAAGLLLLLLLQLWSDHRCCPGRSSCRDGAAACCNPRSSCGTPHMPQSLLHVLWLAMAAAMAAVAMAAPLLASRLPAGRWPWRRSTHQQACTRRWAPQQQQRAGRPIMRSTAP